MVKAGRSSVSPNFNFLGQLVDLERQIFGCQMPSSTGPRRRSLHPNFSSRQLGRTAASDASLVCISSPSQPFIVDQSALKSSCRPSGLNSTLVSTSQAGLASQIGPISEPQISSCNWQTLSQSAASSPVQTDYANQFSSRRLVIRRPSYLPTSGTLPICFPPLQPVANLTSKKRERPTYLNLDASMSNQQALDEHSKTLPDLPLAENEKVDRSFPVSTSNSYFDSQQGSSKAVQLLSNQPCTFNSSTDTENASSLVFALRQGNDGKRSRVSLSGNSSDTAPTSLLPSPCTRLSQLDLSSPSDELRRLISLPVNRPRFLTQSSFPASTRSRIESPLRSSAIMSSGATTFGAKVDPQSDTNIDPASLHFSPFSIYPATGLDKLHFEPCSSATSGLIETRENSLSPLEEVQLMRNLTTLSRSCRPLSSLRGGIMRRSTTALGSTVLVNSPTADSSERTLVSSHPSALATNHRPPGTPIHSSQSLLHSPCPSISGLPISLSSPKAAPTPFMSTSRRGFRPTSLFPSSMSLFTSPATLLTESQQAQQDSSVEMETEWIRELSPSTQLGHWPVLEEERFQKSAPPPLTVSSKRPTWLSCVNSTTISTSLTKVSPEILLTCRLSHSLDELATSPDNQTHLNNIACQVQYGSGTGFRSNNSSGTGSWKRRPLQVAADVIGQLQTPPSPGLNRASSGQSKPNTGLLDSPTRCIQLHS